MEQKSEDKMVTTSKKAEDFVKTPFESSKKLTSLPGIGPVSSAKLATIRIFTSYHLLGLWLQFDNKEEFFDHLESTCGIKFVSNQHGNARQELMQALHAKWKIMEQY